MGLLLINIFTLFLILSFKSGHSLKCHVEIDFTHKNGTRVVEEPDTCNTKIPLHRLFGDNCVKNDCGKYGFWKFCADCDFFELGNMVNGMGMTVPVISVILIIVTRPSVLCQISRS
uniref:Uncharacterized protein n=1 Tax=Meloidogyne enterolobii TaxID=390850 RepID=A0A6V7XGA8_MELEN|nr:unnamed protein product [Meloidogyne enterolobii]